MAQLRLDPTYLHGDTIDRLVATTGHPKPFVVGALALFLHGTRQRHLEVATALELVGFLMVPLPEIEGWLRALMAAGVLDFGPTPDQYRIVANAGIRERFLARQKVMRRAAAVSLAARGLAPRQQAAAPDVQPTPAITPKATSAKRTRAPRKAAAGMERTPFQLLCAASWEAYAQRYTEVVAVAPIRNGKTNTQIINLAKRLGMDLPAVLRFYVGHPGQWFIKKQWSLDALMAEAESMHTQWRKQQPITEGMQRARTQVSDFAQRQQEIAARYRQGHS